MCETVGVDWRSLSAAARIDALVELEARIASLQAAQLALLAVIDTDPVTVSLPGVADKHWAVEDVGCALRLSPGVARARLAEAAQAVRMPQLLELLARGAISLGHVRVLTEATFGLTQAQLGAVAERVLDGAAEQSVGEFRTAVRRAVLAVDARTIATRRLANIAERRVVLRPGGEGTSELWALLPDEGAAALLAAITALADRHPTNQRDCRNDPPDERTADQRRADALVQLGLDALAGQLSTALPRRHRLRPAINVCIALSTLLGVDEEPADLAGIGPISAAAARDLATDPTGTWRRITTDQHGRLIDHGTNTYRPPPAQPP